MSADAAATLAVRLMLNASAYRHGARITGYEHHKGACKATLGALLLLAEEFPHALQVAAHILNDRVEGLAAQVHQSRAADAAKVAQQLVANLRRGAQHFYDGVLPADFHGQEAVDRAAKANRAAHAASVTDAGRASATGAAS